MPPRLAFKAATSDRSASSPRLKPPSIASICADSSALRLAEALALALAAAASDADRSRLARACRSICAAKFATRLAAPLARRLIPSAACAEMTALNIAISPAARLAEKVTEGSSKLATAEIIALRPPSPPATGKPKLAMACRARLALADADADSDAAKAALAAKLAEALAFRAACSESAALALNGSMPSWSITLTSIERVATADSPGVLNSSRADRLGRLALSEATSDAIIEPLGLGGKTPVALSVAASEASADKLSAADRESDACNCATAEAERLADRLACAAAATDSNPEGSSRSKSSGKLKSAANASALSEQKQPTSYPFLGKTRCTNRCFTVTVTRIRRKRARQRWSYSGQQPPQMQEANVRQLASSPPITAGLKLGLLLNLLLPKPFW